jgi:ribulose-phosphate 3-epimerase
MALLRRIRQRARSGLALNPDADVHRLAPYLAEVDLVLVMSVFAGFGGQAYMPEVTQKVTVLREELGFRGEIEMDGGIGPDTIAHSAAAGTNVFVAGTAVFRAPDVNARIAELRHKAEQARG